MNNLNSFSKPRRLFFTIVTGVTVLTLFISCMQSYGRFSSDDRLDQAFKNGEFLKDLNYYYSGRDSKPYAIIGVDTAYTVPSGIWIDLKPESEQMKRMRENTYGGQYYMLTPDDVVVGVWFFGPTNRSVKVDQQNRIVEVMYRIPPRH